jgi:hypothetical protein
MLVSCYIDIFQVSINNSPLQTLPRNAKDVLPVAIDLIPSLVIHGLKLMASRCFFKPVHVPDRQNR